MTTKTGFPKRGPSKLYMEENNVNSMLWEMCLYNKTNESADASVEVPKLHIIKLAFIHTLITIISGGSSAGHKGHVHPLSDQLE